MGDVVIVRNIDRFPARAEIREVRAKCLQALRDCGPNRAESDDPDLHARDRTSKRILSVLRPRSRADEGVRADEVAGDGKRKTDGCIRDVFGQNV
jgi:hypothetical protein